jgi:hypothetical protein
MVRSSTTRSSLLNAVQSCAKVLTRVPVLIAALFLSHSAVSAANVAQTPKSINERVEMVRNDLKRKVTTNQGAANNLSYSERTLTQWNNWGNWGNWNNWVNWNNWNNWRNWGNWGNWGNV